MNREEYRAAFDDLSFSPDFQEKTVELLTQACRQANEKENATMKTRKLKKSVVLVAAAVALLAISASAVMLLLHPKDVAERLEDPLLAAAFEGEEAVVLNQQVETADYQITLAGMVSGEGLSVFPLDVNGGLVTDRSYVVFTIQHTDGTAMEELPDNISYTPLVAGFPVREVNAWTLGSGCQSFVEDGVAYYLYDTQNLQMFADHTVYLAIYEGFVPSQETFDMAEDGSITMTDKLTGTKALFTLPLDPALANPEAVEDFLVQYAAMEG